MEDFVTWVDTSKLKRTIMTYNDEVSRKNVRLMDRLTHSFCVSLTTLIYFDTPYIVGNDTSRALSLKSSGRRGEWITLRGRRVSHCSWFEFGTHRLHWIRSGLPWSTANSRITFFCERDPQGGVQCFSPLAHAQGGPTLLCVTTTTSSQLLFSRYPSYWNNPL